MRSMTTVCAVALLSLVASGEVESPECRQCMESAQHGHCASCAQYIQQTMLVSSQDRMAQVMHALRAASYTRCQKSSTDSKVCQIYLALCDDASACDSALVKKISTQQAQAAFLDSQKIA